MIIPTAPRGLNAVVWSPSSPSARKHPRRFERGCVAIDGLGYPTRVAQSAIGYSPAQYVEAKRLADELHEACRDGDVGLVIATSGGWTSMSLLPHLNFQLLTDCPTVLVGYSDLTVLLNVITARTDMVTFLGPMVLLEFGEANGPWDFTRRSFATAMALTKGQTWRMEYADEWTDEFLPWELDDTRPRTGKSHTDPLRILRSGQGAGRLWGGSMRSIRLLAGTPYWPCPAQSSILLLEDEAMSPDELFANVTSLAWAGAFDRCAGLLVGRFSRPRSNAAGFTDLDSILLRAVPSHVPIIAGLDFGHTEPKHTLPIGATVAFDATAMPPSLEVRMESLT